MTAEEIIEEVWLEEVIQLLFNALAEDTSVTEAARKCPRDRSKPIINGFTAIAAATARSHGISLDNYLETCRTAYEAMDHREIK